MADPQTPSVSSFTDPFLDEVQAMKRDVVVDAGDDLQQYFNALLDLQRQLPPTRLIRADQQKLDRTDAA